MRRLALACAALFTAGSAQAGSFHFDVRPQAASSVQFRIDRDTGGGHQNNWSQTMRLDDLPGIDRATLDRDGPVAFHLTRPAGTLDCRGLAHDHRRITGHQAQDDRHHAAERARS